MFRYKSYYYDAETGLYYLQSRCYDPQVGRFLNADAVEYLGVTGTVLSYNLFAYCENNPVMYSDPNGHIAIALAAGVTLTLTVSQLTVLFALTSFLFLYLYNRDFRNAFNSLVYSITYAVSDGIGVIVNAVKEAIQDAKNGRKYYGTEDHHIVAQTDRRAEWSRDILDDYKIGINSSYNLVTVNKTLHKHLHTSIYHAGVYMFLTTCEGSQYTYAMRRNAVISGLIIIGAILRTGSLAV